jgi:hypothetical protein
MAKINIEHNTPWKAEETFAKIKKFFEDDQDIRRYDPKLKCDFTESTMTGKATGSQFKADIAVKANSGEGSHVAIVVDLPLMLSPFKGKIQETIQKKLAKYLA